MIRYTLVCGNDHEFEGWFRSAAAYEEEEAAGRLECPLCGDRRIRRAPMAPAVHTGNGREPEGRRERLARMLKALRELQRYVEENFEDVGERFPEEARKIHYGETEPRGIRGVARGEEVRELLEEGIEVLPLPRLPEPDA